MELINATRMTAGYTLGMEPDGRERVVVVVKGTFGIPAAAEDEPVLADEQLPLVMADEFTGEPGLSATLYESDFAPVKQRCDVLLNGSAHAPRGRPAPAVSVGLRIGSLSKAFNVLGNRVWAGGAVSVSPTDPEPFVRMPIHYGRAFGGGEPDPKRPDQSQAYAANPVGVGYYPFSVGEHLAGKPLPNTEEANEPAVGARGSYRPMSFGAIGRNFGARVPLAGTYDQNWVDNVFPFLPADFDPLYYQCAPADQQIDPLQGGEWIQLYNLTPAGYTVFRVPKLDVPVEFTNERYERTTVQAVADTLLMEPDEGRFMVSWRASVPLRRDIFELRQAVVGRMSAGWYRARDLGKDYYPSLVQLVAAKAESAE
jgi:hypothetical protein